MAENPVSTSRAVLDLNRLWTRAQEQRWGAGIGALLTVLIGVLFLWLEMRGGDQPLVNYSYDLPFVLRSKGTAHPTDAVIIYLDERSHRELRQSLDRPWDRQLHAQLLERLTESGAAAVVFDIVFLDPSDEPSADDAFVKAIQKNKRVIMAAETVEMESAHGNEPQAARAQGNQISRPHEPFLEAGARWGLATLIFDGNRTVRQHYRDPAEQSPSLSWAVAEFLRVPTTRLAGSKSENRWLNYYGPAGTIPFCSYDQALLPDGVSPNFFRNKTVFIGARPSTGFVGNFQDEFRTPYTFWFKTASTGVEIHATQFLNLLKEDWLTRLLPITELCLVIITGLIFGFGLTFFRPVPAALVAILSAVAVVAVACLMVWKLHHWYSWLIVVLQIAIACIYSIFLNTIRWYLKEQLLMQSLSAHVSPARAKEILRRPEVLEPGAELKELSILFSDIANFSGISEQLPPRELALLLNSYFETSISSIYQTDGTVVKLIGDAIFAIWNAPDPQGDHPLRACQAALLLRKQLLVFDQVNYDMPQLRTRVGIHTGVANVGNFGSALRFDYTAIGDSINLTSRLEGLNKFLGTDILLTEDLLRSVEGKFITRTVGKFRFKGFERIVEVHELVGEMESANSTQAWRDQFGTALNQFQQGKFSLARDLYRQTLELSPNDGPSLFYLEQIDQFQITSPPLGWEGVIDLKEK